MTDAQLHFARFEFKYVLPQALRHDVESELQYFLELDPYVAKKQGHKYFVRSLYFDDAQFSSFNEKHDGLRTRSKFRVRTYTDNPTEHTPTFLEIKGRHNNLVFKHRAALNTDGLGVLEQGDAFSQRILSSCQPSQVKDQFEYQLYRKQLRPVALVDYWRRPYVSKYDPEFRLTFDEQLHGTSTQAMFGHSDDTRRGLVSGYTVLEVKFKRHIPSWFHRIIQSYQLRRVSISKICEAVETLEMAVDYS